MAYGASPQIGSRDAITQALMNIRNPPPGGLGQQPMPPIGQSMGGMQPAGGFPQQQPAALVVSQPPTGPMGSGIGGPLQPGLNLPQPGQLPQGMQPNPQPPIFPQGMAPAALHPQVPGSPQPGALPRY